LDYKFVLHKRDTENKIWRAGKLCSNAVG